MPLKSIIRWEGVKFNSIILPQYKQTAIELLSFIYLFNVVAVAFYLVFNKAITSLGKLECGGSASNVRVLVQGLNCTYPNCCCLFVLGVATVSVSWGFEQIRQVAEKAKPRLKAARVACKSAEQCALGTETHSSS